MFAVVRPPRSSALVAILGVTAALMGGIACNRSDAGAPAQASVPVEVGFVVLEARDVVLKAELAGRAAAYQTSEVRPQVSGILQERLFTEGMRVERGQTLYQIDPRLYRAALAQARADLRGAEATAVAARERAKRIDALAREGLATALELAEVKATAGQAEARVEQATAALEMARINLMFTKVPAPISGRIGRSFTTTGALVTAGQQSPLTTIQNLDPMFVDLQQSSSELLKLRRPLQRGGVAAASKNVELRLEDGSTYEHPGTLQFSEAVVDPNTGSVTIRVTFPNPDGVLLPGMYVRAVVEEGVRKDAIVAPQQGILRDNRGTAVALVLDTEDKAQQREVVTSRAIGDAWLIQSGLQAGDRLIVEGTSKVKPGQLTTPVPHGER